jgi:hydroxymethylbilane synthase
MKLLAEQGYWVNGTSDSLGIEDAQKLFNSQAVGLMLNGSKEFLNLSNSGSAHSNVKTIVTYERELKKVDSDFDKKINETEVFYWTSFFQYQTYLEKYPSIKNKIHACGLGHTFAQFKKNNITVVPFYKMDEFKTWTK